MANTLYDFLPTEPSNSTSGGVNTAEGQNPSTVNDALRVWKQLLARFIDDAGAVNTVGGTANAITVITAQHFDGYGATAGKIGNGTLLAIKASAANTGAATLNVNAIGAKAIRRQGDSAVQADDWAAGSTIILKYDTAYNSGAGAWVLLNPAAPGAPGAASTTVAGLIEIAIAAEYRAGTDTTRGLGVAEVWGAANFVNLGNVSGSYTLNFSTGINFKLAATGNITLSGSNMKAGQSGLIEFYHSGAARTLSLNDGNFNTDDGAALSLSTTSGWTDALSYFVGSDGQALLTVVARNRN